MKHGDFTGLAENYTKYRPDYSAAVLDAILGLIKKPASAADAVDVGAGTGIWTRMLAERGFRTVIAVEPNDDMRSKGRAHPDNGVVQWRAGSGESTSLADSSADLVSMASSFHWVDFDKGIAEFSRVLRPKGCFVAIWNPRYLENNPLLVEIEAHLTTLRPEIKRVSSGRSGLTEVMTPKLESCPQFKDVVYLEGKHTLEFTPERYLGVWRSVNDLRVQLGSDKFEVFLEYVEKRTSGMKTIPATYLTRAWVARKP
jgi:ubiquinone/menaquinone biosynthesis C-methylase UbiE